MRGAVSDVWFSAPEERRWENFQPLRPTFSPSIWRDVVESIPEFGSSDSSWVGRFHAVPMLWKRS